MLVSLRGNFLPSSPGILSNVWRHFWWLQLREGFAPGIQCVRARDPSKHPTIHRMVPTTENYWAQHVNTNKAEKPIIG